MFAQTSYKQQKIHRCTHGTRLFQSYYAQWNFVHHRLYINQETIKSQSIKNQTYINTWEHYVQVNNKICSWYNKSKLITSMM